MRDGAINVIADLMNIADKTSITDSLKLKELPGATESNVNGPANQLGLKFGKANGEVTVQEFVDAVLDMC